VVGVGGGGLACACVGQSPVCKTRLMKLSVSDFSIKEIWASKLESFCSLWCNNTAGSKQRGAHPQHLQTGAMRFLMGVLLRVGSRRLGAFSKIKRADRGVFKN